MQYTCNVCGELFPNRFSLDRHKKNCTKSKNEDESSPFETFLKGALVVGGIVYTARKVFEAFEKRNQSDTDSASTSGIPGGTRCRGMRHPSKREYNPPRLGGIGIRSANARSSHARSSHATWDIENARSSHAIWDIENARSSHAIWDIDPFFEDVNDSGVRVLGEECDAGLVEALETEVPNIDFRSRVTVRKLNNFIDNKLQPTKEFNQEMAIIVHNLCEYLKQEMNPSQIKKGGSLGKGTSVRGRCDMDLVMILNGVRDAEDLKKQLPTIKRQIKDTLGRYSGRITIVPDSLTENRFHVKFSVESRLGEIDVDLLPTFKYEDLHNHYRNLTNDEADNIAFYSVSLVERRVSFVKECTRQSNVKNLIRLVKYWKKEMVLSDRRIPNSYLMELITIHLWQKNGSCDVFNMLKAFHSVMKALENYSRLNVFWTTNYFESEIPYEVLCERPLVLDPSNPTNNVCSGCEWDDIQREAIKVLRSPMLEDVSSTSWK